MKWLKLYNSSVTHKNKMYTEEKHREQVKRRNEDLEKQKRIDKRSSKRNLPQEVELGFV